MKQTVYWIGFLAALALAAAVTPGKLLPVRDEGRAGMSFRPSGHPFPWRDPIWTKEGAPL